MILLIQAQFVTEILACSNAAATENIVQKDMCLSKLSRKPPHCMQGHWTGCQGFQHMA